jgi:hypothetical protein
VSECDESDTIAARRGVDKGAAAAAVVAVAIVTTGTNELNTVQSS